MFNLSVKVNPKQKSILFDAMVRHRHVLEGRTFALRSYKNDLWEKLTARLNMHGPQKDVAQWKKCLTDLRLAIRKKTQRPGKQKRTTIDRSHNDYGRRIVKSVAIPENSAEEVESFPIVDEAAVDTHIKEEQPEERVTSKFEEVNLPILETETDQDLMRGTIKIEDPELFPNDCPSENESLFLSRDHVNNERASPIELQTSLREPDGAGKGNLQELYLLEILKESRKQTALLKKLLSRLPQ